MLTVIGDLGPNDVDRRSRQRGSARVMARTTPNWQDLKRLNDTRRAEGSPLIGIVPFSVFL